MAKRDLNTDSGKIDSDSLCTPSVILHPMYELWSDPIGTDPCTNEHSIVRARRHYTFGGLSRPWLKETYANWPYSTNEPWADKAIHELKVGHTSELLILCMVATSTMWWKKVMTKPRRNPRVICTKRIAFLGPGGIPLESGARFDTALIYYGKHHGKFDRLFAHVARWSTWGR